MDFKKFQINIVSQAYDDKTGEAKHGADGKPIKNWKSVGNLIVFKHTDGRPDGYKVELHMIPTSPTVQIVVTDPDKAKAAKPTTTVTATAPAQSTGVAYPKDEISPDDIPF